jgi:hypothetical protein
MHVTRRNLMLVALLVLLVAVVGCRDKSKDTVAAASNEGGAGGAGGTEAAAKHLAMANRYLALATEMDPTMVNSGKTLSDAGASLSRASKTLSPAGKSLSDSGASLSTSARALSPATSMSPAAGKKGMTGNALSPAAKPLDGQKKAGTPEEYMRLASSELAQASTSIGSGAADTAVTDKEKMLSPAARSLSASSLSMTLAGQSLSTADKQLSPAGASLSKAARDLSPPGPVPISRERNIALARRHAQNAAMFLASLGSDKTISPAATDLVASGKTLSDGANGAAAQNAKLGSAKGRLVSAGASLSNAGRALSPKAGSDRAQAMSDIGREIATAEAYLAAAATSPKLNTIDTTLSPRQMAPAEMMVGGQKK